MKPFNEIRTAVEGAVHVGEVLPAATYLDVLDSMLEAMGLAFTVLGERYQFTFEAAMRSEEDLPEAHICWFKLYDAMGYCHVVSYAVRSHLEEDPAYKVSLSQTDVDAINVAAALMNRAAEFLDLPPLPLDRVQAPSLN